MSAERRKVLIIVENLSVPFDRRVWRESLALTEAGYQVSVICPKGKDGDNNSFDKIQGISIYRYGLYQSNGGFLSYVLEYTLALIMTIWLIMVVFCREGFDVVHICNPPDVLIIVAVPFKLLGKKIVYDQHDLSPEIYEMHEGGAKKKLVLSALLFFERLTYLFSDIVLATNESFKSVAISRGRKKEQDIYIVRNGPALENIETAKPNNELKHGARYLISYVGMMGLQDGIDILLEIISTLKSEFKRNDFHVLIIGDGTMFKAANQLAVDLNIDHLVTFAGRVDYERVMEGIASADVCICPDPKTPVNDKSTLVKVIEYMSLGRPLVAFDLQEVRNSAGDAALYAAPGDVMDFAMKVNILLDNAALRGAMGKIGRERAMNCLLWEHSKRVLYDAYNRLFKSFNPAKQLAS